MKEIDNNDNIKTYLSKIEPIIKEIIYKDKNECYWIREKIERIREIIKYMI